MSTAELPLWSEPVPDSEPDGKIVTCGCCDETMSWRKFIDHGPKCDGSRRGNDG